MELNVLYRLVSSDIITYNKENATLILCSLTSASLNKASAILHRTAGEYLSLPSDLCK